MNSEWNQAVMSHLEADINQMESQLGMMRTRLRQFQNVNRIGPGVPLMTELVECQNDGSVKTPIEVKDGEETLLVQP